MSVNKGGQLLEETLRELAEIVLVGNRLLDRAHRISQTIREQVRQAMKDKARREEQADLEASAPTPVSAWSETEDRYSN